MWSADEYNKLTNYDGDIPEQRTAHVFLCHQREPDDTACAGWLGHRKYPTDLLAVRLGLSNGTLHPDVADYSTDVKLFPTGAAAAAHGKRDLAEPALAAELVIEKISRKRNL